MEARVAVLETAVRGIQASLERIERNQEAAATAIMTAISGLRTSVDADIRELRGIVHTNFLWLLGIMLTLAGGGFVLMAHGFHWIP